MPIYEFYCPDCHTLFSFFSSRVDTTAAPACPSCGRPELGRRPSRFATLRRAGEEGDAPDSDDPLAGLDDERLERAMAELSGDLEGLDGDGPQDPRTVSRFLRRFSELTGLEAGPRMREMLERLDRGEDPDALEEELGGGEEGDDDLGDFFKLKPAALARRLRRPKIDETLYFL
ncbi:MAG: zinc ribbon domain-containing protein [Acidobacteria bacterium]|nr:zinc ribbon domain-containing protein [Acidobacteriota bacterium]